MAETMPLIPTEVDYPVPPRFWWLKRIAVAVGALMVVLSVVRWWWGHNTARRLQTEIDALRARGEPIYPADFDPPYVADKDNAASLLMQAAGSLRTTSAQFDLLQLVARDPLGAIDRLDELTKIVESNAAALTLMRQARARPHADWGFRWGSPAIMSIIRADTRVAYLAIAAGVTAHVRGDHEEAIESLRDALACASAYDEHAILPCHVQAMRLSALVSAVVELAGPELVASQNDHEVTARVALALIADLLDERAVHRNYLMSIQAERMASVDAFRAIAVGKLSPDFGGMFSGIGRGQSSIPIFPVAPMFESDAIWILHLGSDYVAASTATDWPTTFRKLPGDPTRRVGADTLSEPGREWLRHVDLRQPMIFHYRGLALRRMAAVRIAIALFETEHKRPPEHLSQLVPQFLANVPADPFAEDTRSLGYRPDTDRLRLYSVYVNGTDQQGDYPISASKASDYDPLDLPFFLSMDWVASSTTRNARFSVDLQGQN